MKALAFLSFKQKMNLTCVSVFVDGAVSPDFCMFDQSQDPKQRRVEALKRQLHIEHKVKQGAENIIQMFSTGTFKVSNKKDYLWKYFVWYPPDLYLLKSICVTYNTYEFETVSW